MTQAVLPTSNHRSAIEVRLEDFPPKALDFLYLMRRTSRRITIHIVLRYPSP
jgi:hypothetical protein